MKLILLHMIFFVVYLPLFAQHSASYSQYLFNGLAINPAYAGKNEALTLTLSHRNQWAGIEGAPLTTTASIHGILKNEKVGVGLLFYNDQLGINKNNAITGTYAYRINTGNFKIALGLQAGAVINAQKWSEVETTRGFDDVIPPNSTFIRPVVGSGIYLYSKNFFAGLSVPQLISFQTSTLDKSKYYKSYLFTIGHSLQVDKELELKPSVLFKYIKNSPVQADFNLLVAYRKFLSGGVSYRTKNTIVVLLQSQLTTQFNIGYSYDHFFGKVGNHGGGSHELMIGYVMAYKLNAKGARSF
jgi:type IX secretion system PorP/SprF family membrane protein